MKTTKQIKNNTFWIILFSFFILNSSFLIDKAMAQAISLSVSPPLFELMIQPNKQVKQIFTITNLGGDSIITPSLVYFESTDGTGNVNLTENQAPDWVIYNKTPFNLKGQEKFDFEILFSPPSDDPEIDHLLTLVFETNEPVDLLGQNSTTYTSKIGANILLTISKDGSPEKKAEIIEFSAPKIIDSLYPIRYTLKLANNGNSFWKPNGKIIVNKEILNLAPQNILSNSLRKMKCIDNEILINCELKTRFYVGKIVSKLEFTIDEEPKVYKLEITTYSLPLTLVGVVVLLILVWRKLKR